MPFLVLEAAFLWQQRRTHLGLHRTVQLSAGQRCSEGLGGGVQALSMAISLNIENGSALPPPPGNPPEPDQLVRETRNRSHLRRRSPSRSGEGPGEEGAGSRSRRECRAADGVPAARPGARCLHTTATVVGTERKTNSWQAHLQRMPGLSPMSGGAFAHPVISQHLGERKGVSLQPWRKGTRNGEGLLQGEKLSKEEGQEPKEEETS